MLVSSSTWPNPLKFEDDSEKTVRAKLNTSLETCEENAYGCDLHRIAEHEGDMTELDLESNNTLIACF